MIALIVALTANPELPDGCYQDGPVICEIDATLPKIEVLGLEPEDQDETDPDDDWFPPMTIPRLDGNGWGR